MTTVILNKEYDGESILDCERDIYEALNEADLPTDEYCFASGTFKIVITFREFE